MVIDTEARRLYLCAADGRSDAEYPVSLGRGGVGKRREGDGKTPLGVYPLGEPRRSTGGFDTFIPVGYPTRAQREAGLTGGAIGIHGPPVRWPEPLNRLAVAVGDWTLGCIAVASVREIRAIAAWVRGRRPKQVFLLPVPT